LNFMRGTVRQRVYLEVKVMMICCASPNGMTCFRTRLIENRNRLIGDAALLRPARPSDAVLVIGSTLGPPATFHKNTSPPGSTIAPTNHT
jgi:hypothetical protein